MGIFLGMKFISKSSYIMEGITGKYKAFEIFWDGGTNKEDKEKYRLVCMLHGIKSYLGHFTTEDEAKVYVENKVLPTWIKGLSDEQKVP